MLRESLFTRPSFLSGIARLFDFWGTFNDYNRSPTDEIADIRAIGSDWRVVGDDIRVAIRRYDVLHPEPRQIEPCPRSTDE